MHAYKSHCVLTTEDRISVNRQHMLLHCMHCRSRKQASVTSRCLSVKVMTSLGVLLACCKR